VETLSLKELKAQNAESDQPEEKPVVEDEYIEVDPETEEPIEVEEPEELKVEEGDSDEDEQTEDSDDLEEWQKSEINEDGKKGEFKPSAEAKKLRLKNKDLKAKQEERDAELENLRQEVERLSSAPKPKEEALPPRPTLESFDFDEDKYAEALDSWYDLRMERKANSFISKTQQQTAEQQQLEAQAQARESAVTAHLEKAAKLINDNKITQDNWMAADKLVRQTLDLSFPGKGNDIADQFIALMENNGEGGEKAWYYLGRNPAALAEFRDKLMSDPTGASGVMHLASIQQKTSQPIRKKRSDAPKPAASLKGDAPNGNAKSMKKSYDKAGKSGDIETRIKLKRQAKAAGVDVSSW